MIVGGVHAAVTGCAVQQKIDALFGLEPVSEFISGSETALLGDKECRLLDHVMDAEIYVFCNHLFVLVVAFRPVSGVPSGFALQLVIYAIRVEIFAIVEMVPRGVFAFSVITKLFFDVHIHLLMMHAVQGRNQGGAASNVGLYFAK